MGTTERWLPIRGHEGHYEVSDQGRVRSLPRIVTYSDGRRRRYPGRLLRPARGHGGYRTIQLRGRTCRVHVLVAEAFLERLPGQVLVRHRDGDPEHDAVENLVWGTQSENMLDRVAHGRHVYANKSECVRGHAYDEANTGRRKSRGGRGRYCRACLREDGRRIYWAKKQGATT
jgi:hypothetical protein